MKNKTVSIEVIEAMAIRGKDTSAYFSKPMRMPPRQVAKETYGLKNKIRKSVVYERGLVDRLRRDRELALSYLKSSAEDCNKGSNERFAMAVGHVQKAFGKASRSSGHRKFFRFNGFGFPVVLENVPTQVSRDE